MRDHSKHRAAELLIGSAGLIFIGVSLAANQSWLDRHVLPSFLVPRVWYVAIESAIRIAAAGVGLGLTLAARAIAACLTRRRLLLLLEMLAAAALALVAAEIVLRSVDFGPAQWLIRNEEPLRRPDPILGWTIVPARSGRAMVAGRLVTYTVDASGYRVHCESEPVDPAKPTAFFAGESVMFGYGLTWDESIPAQVSKRLGLQSANLAVNGFGTDQAYLRLEQELPRFRRPVAVVMLFMTTLLGRNLDRDRPHLAPGLVWRPAERMSRLLWLARLVVPYHRSRTIADGIAMTREVLRATTALARARGATPLVVIPQFGSEPAADARLRHRIFDGSGIPFVIVELDPAWHLPWDRHPDARGARAIAAAIAARLAETGESSLVPSASSASPRVSDSLLPSAPSASPRATVSSAEGCSARDRT